jgi:hypothetical protein
VVIQLNLVAGDDADITISTEIQLDTGDPRWPARLVDTITIQAQEGARALRDQLFTQQALPSDGFVPLAAVVLAAHAATRPSSR